MLPAGTTDLANRGPLPPGDAAASHPVAVRQGAGRSRGTPTGDQDDGHHNHRDDGSGDCDEDDADDRAHHDSILIQEPLWATGSLAQWLASPSLHSPPPAPVRCSSGSTRPGERGGRALLAGPSRPADLWSPPSGRLLRADDGGWEDDAAVDHGVGFTDAVKRPTARASDVRPEEYSYGRPLLVERLEGVQERLVIFTFKATATAYFGRFDGGGFLPGKRVGMAGGLRHAGADGGTVQCAAEDR